MQSTEYEEFHGNNLSTLQTQLSPMVRSVKLLYLAKVCDPCVMQCPLQQVQIWLLFDLRLQTERQSIYSHYLKYKIVEPEEDKKTNQ